MRCNPYLSRPVGSKEPSSFRRPRRQIEVKEVFIGQHAPTDHYVPGIADPSLRYIKQEELYVPRKQRQKRR